MPATRRRRRPIARPTGPAPSFSRRSAEADDPRVIRARLAVERFRRMVPGLTGFAKMITRDDSIRVVVSAGSPHTDGKNIYLRPPIELGDRLDHTRDLCDKRDLYGPLCLACKRQEEIMMGLYHEIAHIAYESFQSVTDEDKRNLLTRALKEAGDPDDGATRAGKIKQRVETGLGHLAASGQGVTYIGMAGLVSPYLPTLVNAMEDWRVNASLHAARPGTREAFAARYRKVMECGVTEMDGTTWYWADRPLDSQFLVGVLLKLCGYAYDSLDPRVIEALDSDEVARATKDAPFIRSVRGVYQMAFGVLEAARANGLLKASDDPEDDLPPMPTEPGEPDAEDTDGDSDDEGDPDPGDDSGDRPSSTPGTESDDGEGNADGLTEKSEERGDPGAEDGDTDEPSDEDSTGESDGDASEDDEGAGSGAGDSDDADGDKADGDGADTTDDEADTDGADTTDDEADTDIDSDASGMRGTGAAGDSDDGDLESDGDDEDGDDEGAGTSGEPADGPTPGDPDEVAHDLDKFLGHDNPGWFPTDGEPPEGEPDPADIDPEADSAEIDRAIVQGEHFDRPSSGLFGVKMIREGDDYPGPYKTYAAWQYAGTDRAREGMTEAGENILGPSLMRMRLAFANNKKRKNEHNLKSGRVNSRMLGKRAAVGDPRLFQKPHLPGKRDYFVVIGLDISGSTSGRRIQIMKSAALAQAELLERTGVNFAFYAHTGAPGLAPGGEYSLDLDIYVIKEPGEPWSERTRNRLRDIYASAANLDGHTLEFYRKVLDQRRETDRVVMYYTDGAMPAENYDEELSILTDEIKTYALRGYTLLAVGVQNSEPEQYGLDTVRLDSIEDVPAVVKHLEKRLIMG